MIFRVNKHGPDSTSTSIKNKKLLKSSLEKIHSDFLMDSKTDLIQKLQLRH